MKRYIFPVFALASFLACKSAKTAAPTPPPVGCVEEVKPDCICTMQYDPVCGCNDKTYGNACLADCAGIKTYKKGECPKDAGVKLEVTVWQLAEIGSPGNAQAIPSDIDISIKLEEGRLSGRGGCNNIGGSYSLNKDKLQFGQVMTTKMFCENAMQWETRFLQFLGKSQSYAIKGETLEIHCGDLGKLTFKQAWKKPRW
jgi:Heat shock protein